MWCVLLKDFNLFETELMCNSSANVALLAYLPYDNHLTIIGFQAGWLQDRFQALGKHCILITFMRKSLYKSCEWHEEADGHDACWSLWLYLDTCMCTGREQADVHDACGRSVCLVSCLGRRLHVRRAQSFIVELYRAVAAWAISLYIGSVHIGNAHRCT